ncbi:MAG: sigma-70 family RNA polymerase sigma factor [Acidobacteriota bacterium]
MAGDRLATRNKPDASWPDERLVSACLEGHEEAWGALVDKYSQMVFTVVRRYGVPHDDATDLFQAIWLDSYNDLEKLRKPEAFRSWLITLARNKCFHWQRKLRVKNAHEVASPEDSPFEPEDPDDQPELIEQIAREQLVRDAILELTPRCRELIRHLFFTFPPKPYKEIAQSLGLAVGSIGFTRGRCLERLHRQLTRHGFS